MRTKLFVVSLLTLGLVTMGAVMSFAADADTATISATVGGVRDVAMGDLGFGGITVGYTKAESDLTFNSNYVSNVLRIWTANAAGPGMVSGANSIPLRYNFDIDGADSPAPTDGNWTTDWTLVADNPATDADKNELYSGGPIDKSTAGDATFDFATKIESTTSEGSYSTVLNLEIVSP